MATKQKTTIATAESLKAKSESTISKGKKYTQQLFCTKKEKGTTSTQKSDWTVHSRCISKNIIKSITYNYNSNIFCDIVAIKEKPSVTSTDSFLLICFP